MYIIIKHNGDWILGLGLALDNKGIVRKFISESKADIWAKNNCVFNYKIVAI